MALSRKCVPFTPFDRTLPKSTIAIVTAAGVHLKEQEPFNIADEGFIGGVAKKHIGYMGYTMQLKAMYEGTAKEIANEIDKSSRADVVVLTGG